MPDSNFASICSLFLGLVPEKIPDRFRIGSKDFSRDRLLPFPQLISLILSLSASDKGCGLSIKIGEFFKNARRSGLLSSAQSCSAAALRKARAKISFQVFRDIFYNAVDLADSLWDKTAGNSWHNRYVYAIDSSMYSLPASDQIRDHFDPPKATKQFKNHFPQCLVSTVYDVFRRLPIARSVAPCNASERQEAQLLLSHIPDNGVLLLDRGYPGYEFIRTVMSDYNGHFAIRCKSTYTFPAVEDFLKSNSDDKLVHIMPSRDYLECCDKEERARAKPLPLRVIRLKSPDGTVSAIITNLICPQQFPLHDIIDLYYQRYRIEEYYRHEKVCIEIERFHSESVNGIQQELFSAAIVSVIAQMLMHLTRCGSDEKHIEPQFKNAVIAFAHDAFVLTPIDGHKAVEIFKELLQQIASVVYYKPRNKRKAYPRATKKAPNKWCRYREQKLKNQSQNDECQA